MFKSRVLPLLWLFLEAVTPFTWDIVVAGDKTLEFYDNGTLTYKQEIPEATNIYSIAYDPVHDRVLICDHIDPNATISSYDISTKQIQYLFTKTSDGFNKTEIDYDPVTQLVLLKEPYSLWSYSLNPAASKKERDGKLIAELKWLHYCYDIAVDINGRYLYWVTDQEIERIRFDGSEREVIIRDNVLFRLSLAIDQESQKIYWIEDRDVPSPLTIESADLRGQNRTTVYTQKLPLAGSLAVTKDYIYWQIAGTWQLPKNPSGQVARELDSIPKTGRWYSNRVVAKYTIKEQN